MSSAGQPLHNAAIEVVFCLSCRLPQAGQRCQIVFHFKHAASLRALCCLKSGSHYSPKCFTLQKALDTNSGTNRQTKSQLFKGSLKTVHQKESKKVRVNKRQSMMYQLSACFHLAVCQSACRAAQIMHESSCLSADL